MFLYPDSKRCAEKYGEGPDADYEIGEQYKQNNERTRRKNT